ncbi:MAG: GGDEF domain-containing protein [Gallionella sp.]|jgi:diguanylate cyclase
MPSSEKTGTPQAAGYSERAMTMMRGLQVQPTPKNYSVFFAVAAGQPTDLIKEVDRIISEKQRFTEDMLDHLYNHYIAEAQSRALQETATNAKRILAEMISNVGAFTGATHNMSQEVSHQLEGLETPLTEDAIRQMAKTVIDSAQAIVESGGSMNQQLATAQKEISELRENLAKATIESERDFLTAAYNRKAFDKRLLQALEEAKANESDLTLIMLDIDHFKLFNDNFGHLIGDEVLKIVAKTIGDSVKGMDTVARFGGEEFAVILPKTPVGGGMIVAESIRKTIASKELKRKSTGEHYGQITISLGVAAFRHHDDSPATLIKRADDALYRSKKAGRNRVTQENLSE